MLLINSAVTRISHMYDLAMRCRFATLSAVGSAFTPYGCEPRLLVARKSRRAIVMQHLEEPSSANVIAPGVEIEEAAIAITA